MRSNTPLCEYITVHSFCGWALGFFVDFGYYKVGMNIPAQIFLSTKKAYFSWANTRYISTVIESVHLIL